MREQKRDGEKQNHRLLAPFSLSLSQLIPSEGYTNVKENENNQPICFRYNFTSSRTVADNLGYD